MITDYKVVIYPTKTFQDEQYRLNTHHKNIQEHRVSEEGNALIKPMRDQYPTPGNFKSFQEAQKMFETAASD